MTMEPAIVLPQERHNSQKDKMMVGYAQLILRLVASLSI